MPAHATVRAPVAHLNQQRVSKISLADSEECSSIMSRKAIFVSDRR